MKIINFTVNFKMQFPDLEVIQRLIWHPENIFWVDFKKSTDWPKINKEHWILPEVDTIPSEGHTAYFAHGKERTFKALFVEPPTDEQMAVFLCTQENMIRHQDGSGKIAFKPIEVYGFVNDDEFTLGLKSKPTTKRQRIPINVLDDMPQKKRAVDTSDFVKDLINYHSEKGVADITTKLHQDLKSDPKFQNIKFRVKVIIEQID